VRGSCTREDGLDRTRPAPAARRWPHRGLDLGVSTRTALGSLTPGAREWDMTRYRAYQAQLAGQPVGAIFRRAAAFLRLAAKGSSLSRT